MALDSVILNWEFLSDGKVAVVQTDHKGEPFRQVFTPSLLELAMRKRIALALFWAPAAGKMKAALEGATMEELAANPNAIQPQ